MGVLRPKSGFSAGVVAFGVNCVATGPLDRTTGATLLVGDVILVRGVDGALACVASILESSCGTAPLLPPIRVATNTATTNAAAMAVTNATIGSRLRDWAGAGAGGGGAA